MDDRGDGVRFPVEARDISLLHNFQTGSGFTPPPTQWVAGAVSPEAKRQERETDL
jgi:hypothetical protein